MEKKMKLFIVLFFYSLNSLAIEEANFEKIYQILNDATTYETKSFSGRKGLKVGYLKYGKKRGNRGTVLISTGRTEMAQKFLELAYDLHQLGFSPVYITSHRGQGFSQRGIKHQFKGYVRKFIYYSDDLNTMAKIIKSENQGQKLFLIGHSMGGAIGMEYLQRYKSVFEKAAFTAPMVQIYFKDGGSERSALKDTALACFIPFKPYCTSYVPGGGNPNPNPNFENNEVTSSETRFSFKKELFRQFPGSMVGSATIRWVRESIYAGQRMRSKKNLQNNRHPFLVFMAGLDTVVDNRGIELACGRTDLCESVLVSGALHNLFMERDELRDPIMKKIDKFFK
jgi:lysophospholipase